MNTYKDLIRNYLPKLWNKQFLIFLFFLFLSGAFWIFQALNEIYEHEFKIPVEVTNLPEDYVITTAAAPFIEVELRDRGITLMNYQYGFNFKPIVVDHKRYANHSEHVRIPTKDLLKQLSSQMASSTQILLSKPDSIEYYYNNGLHKRVPVVLQGKVKAENGYILTQTRLSHDSVTVYASEKLLEEIHEARVKVNHSQAISDTTQLMLEIQPVKGAKFEPEALEFQAFVDRLVQKKVKATIRPEGFPKDQLLLPIPQEVDIVFQVGMNNYRDITEKQFIVVASYQDLPKDGSNYYPLRLRLAPKEVKRIRLIPEKVEYVIEKVLPKPTAADSLQSTHKRK